MDPDSEIPSRIQDPSLKPLKPLYVDSWASLDLNMIITMTYIWYNCIISVIASPALAFKLLMFYSIVT